MSDDELFRETHILKKKNISKPGKWVEDRAETIYVIFQIIRRVIICVYNIFTKYKY